MMHGSSNLKSELNLQTCLTA